MSYEWKKCRIAHNDINLYLDGKADFEGYVRPVWSDAAGCTVGYEARICLRKHVEVVAVSRTLEEAKELLIKHVTTEALK